MVVMLTCDADVFFPSLFSCGLFCLRFALPYSTGVYQPFLWHYGRSWVQCGVVCHVIVNVYWL